MALKQPQIEIVGISSITYVDYSYDIINKILKWHNKGVTIPVYKVTKADDLGIENDGTRALYEALKKKLTILALGPMTNIATLIQNHPIIPQIENINLCSKNSWITV
jgi:pyrimidine-specific ribonucleoside hydrolase